MNLLFFLEERVRRNLDKTWKGEILEKTQIERDSFFFKREKAAFFDRFKIILELFDTPDDDGRGWIFRETVLRFYPWMGSAKWQRHARPSILGVLWGTASFTSQGFVGVRRSGSTVSYIRVNYSDDINIGAPFCSNGTGFIPPLLWGVLYTAVRQEEVLRNLLSQGVLSSDLTMENSVLKVIIQYFFQLCFLDGWRSGVWVFIFLEINGISFWWFWINSLKNRFVITRGESSSQDEENE